MSGPFWTDDTKGVSLEPFGLNWELSVLRAARDLRFNLTSFCMLRWLNRVTALYSFHSMASAHPIQTMSRSSSGNKLSQQGGGRHDTESSILMYDDMGEPKEAWQHQQVADRIYWSLFYLNFVCIWAYQSMVSAQDYYSIEFPDAQLSFWGIVAVGSAMLFTHLLSVLLDGDRRMGFTKRIVPSYVGFIFVAFMVAAWRRAASIIAGFAIIGVLNAMSQVAFGRQGLPVLRTPIFLVFLQDSP